MREENDYFRGKVEQQGLEIARLGLRLETCGEAQDEGPLEAAPLAPTETVVAQVDDGESCEDGAR